MYPYSTKSSLITLIDMFYIVKSLYIPTAERSECVTVISNTSVIAMTESVKKLYSCPGAENIGKRYFSPPDYVTRNLIGQLGNIDFAITNFNP